MTPDHPLYDRLPQTRLWLKLILGVIVAGLAAMWIYAFFFASRDNVNSLGDGEWTQRAEVECAAADKAISALPTVPELTNLSPEALTERAVVLEESNDILDGMLDKLEATEPADSEGARIAKLWLGDYRIYLNDRIEYAIGLRAATVTEFGESTIDNMPITNFINDVARQNKMPSCQAPGLS
jgi:hypothetical protein